MATPEWLARRVLLATIAAACGGGTSQGRSTAPDEVHDSRVSHSREAPDSRLLDSLLSSAVEHTRLPGFAAIIVGPDSTLALGAEGVRRRGMADEMTTRDRFHIGSNAKALTANMIASLVKDGVLEWHTRVADAMPRVAERMHPGYGGITVEQLLAHTAGLPPFTSGRDWSRAPSTDGDARTQRAAFAAWVLARPPASPPGEMEYSNAGYAVAAALAETVTGLAWEQLLEEHVLKPLGISAASGWPAARGAPQPWGHWRLLGLLRPQDPDGAYQLRPTMAPAGDVHMPLEEYGRFLQSQLRGLLGRDDLLPAAIVRHMHRPGAGLGWGVRLHDGQHVSVHAGSAGTFFIVAMIDPSRELAAAVVTNAGAAPAPDATRELLQTIMQLWSERPRSPVTGP